MLTCEKEKVKPWGLMLNKYQEVFYFASCVWVANYIKTWRRHRHQGRNRSNKKSLSEFFYHSSSYDVKFNIQNKIVA